MPVAKNNPDIPTWIQNRILDFMNSAPDAATIMETVKDDPDRSSGSTGKDVAIGRTVSQRIIDQRNALPGRRYRTFSQLTTIKGIGPDKFQDLTYTFGNSADETFRNSMYDGVIFESNFDLQFRDITIEDRDEFLKLVDNECLFKDAVAKILEGWVAERSGNRQLGQTAGNYLRNCWLEATRDAFTASYYFAYWFFRFDADNWFSFDRVRQETEAYLSYNSGVSDRLELRFFKGFRNLGLLADAISPDDLPVVVNYGEQKISVWRGDLRD